MQYLLEEGAEVEVVRSDRTSPAELEALGADALLVGPGPGTPERAGCTHDALRRLSSALPTLGVCLGHQAIGTVFGGHLRRSRTLLHGHTTAIEHDGRGVFRGLPSPFRATRYNSLVIDEESLPSQLTVSARAPDGEVMGLRHADWPLEGVQFHPEAVESQHGHSLLRNFLRAAHRPDAVGALAPRDAPDRAPE